jgi:Uma2 family endonuclease
MASGLTKPMTAEEFYHWVHRPENRDKHFELEEGEVVEMSLPGKKHCLVCGNGVRLLGNYTHLNQNGNVIPNDLGIILERDPDTVRGPDIALYLETIAFDEQESKYSDILPKLIVEVISPNDRWTKMQKRIMTFLRKGVKMVWLLDPEDHTVTVYLPNASHVVLEGDDEVSGFGILPNFSCKASDFFVSAGKSI